MNKNQHISSVALFTFDHNELATGETGVNHIQAALSSWAEQSFFGEMVELSTVVALGVSIV